MKITLEMVLTNFFQENPEIKTHSGTYNQLLLGIQLLPGETSQLSPDYLYVTDHFQSDLFSEITDDIPVICFTMQKNIAFHRHNIIFLKTDMNLADGFNSLQKCFNMFADWERRLDFAVFRNAEFQEFIDLSEEILASPILIYDPALKLLAYSKNHPTLDDHIYQTAINNGYLDYETVKYLEADKIFAQIDSTGIAVGEPDGIRMHADFSRAINIHNELAVYCVLLYTGNFSRSYTNQLFQILCDSIQNLLEKQHSDFLRDRSVTDYFLMDLLDNPDTSKEQIIERLSYNDLDYEGNYIVISLHTDMKKKVSENYFIQILRNNMINCRIFSYQNNIVILYLLPKFRNINYRNYLTEKFGHILKDFSKYKIQLYFSRPFSTIGEFSAAYIQAENISKMLSEKDKQTFCFYEDYWIMDLFFMNSSPNTMFSYCEPALLTMLQADTKKSRQQMQILYEYLHCDRKLTDVANKLGMHRNNIIYHIRHIEEIYKLNLDDSQTRLKLLLSFEILKFEKKIPFISDQAMPLHLP
jgi:sugar diacid utilization regulator